MESNRWHSYTTSYRLQIVKYVEDHGKKNSKRHFEQPVTEKVIRNMVWPAGNFEQLYKGKYAKHIKYMKWLEIESIVLEWVQENQQKGIVISTKSIYIHVVKTVCEYMLMI